MLYYINIYSQWSVPIYIYMLIHSHVECVRCGWHSSSSIYRTGPFPGAKSPIEPCALGGGGGGRCVLS